MQNIAIKLQDEDGKVVRWMISRDARTPAWWNFTDHEGYMRSVEGNWRELVARFKGSAENYNLALLSELS